MRLGARPGCEMKEQRAGIMESIGPSGPPESSPFSTVPQPTAPKQIGRYQLCFELASGGMASVYLARADGGAPGFEKLVALKRIHPHLSSETDYVEMFLDEARIASRITHANVCSVFDFGDVDGEYFIAMEYLVGEPLARVQRRVVANAEQRTSPLLPARMARVIAGACEGLHAAHELKDDQGEPLNVVHRDVSAENLFVTYDGVVQVVDFGIAHASKRVHHTSAGQVKGTFPYMAPEQMTAAVVDRRVDVWALGAVLWELLTLRRLFLRDTDVNTMYAVLSGEIRPPSDYRKDVPPELDEIVLKALQRNPEERWQNARDMGKALRRFLAKQDDLVGPAELADWMQDLFPRGAQGKRQLMEIARGGGSDDAKIPEMPAKTRSRFSIPQTRRRSKPGGPPLSAGLLALAVGGGLVALMLALEWLR